MRTGQPYTKAHDRSGDAFQKARLCRVIRHRKPFRDPNEVNRLVDAYRFKHSRLAGNELVRGNMGMVVQIALRYMGVGLSLDDLVQEGLVGLVKAIRRYDANRAQLNTYAPYWIYAEIKQALHRESPAHSGFTVSYYEYRRTHLVRGAIAKLTTRNGCQPDSEEILREIRRGSGKLNKEMSLADVERCLRITGKQRSLDECVYDGNGSLTFLDCVPDQRAVMPETACSFREEHERFRASCENLCPRDVIVLDLRYRQGKTLKEIGEQFGLSRERIRQVQVRALERLGVTETQYLDHLRADEAYRAAV